MRRLVENSGAYALGACVLSAWVLVPILLFALAAFAQNATAAGSGGDLRDFPPLIDRNRPQPAVSPSVPETAAPPESVIVNPPSAVPFPTPAGTEAFHLGVGDEVNVSVIGEPTFSRVVKVRPDGALTAPGVGTVFVLGRSPEEVGREIQARLNQILRHPQVDLMVEKYSDRRVFVMGEVPLPGTVTYFSGMSALQAIAASGGIKESGKSGGVFVLRRVGSDEVEAHRCDLTGVLKGKSTVGDFALEPFDIVFVPRNLITDVDLFVDRVIRPAISPFTLYLEGWNAININKYRVRYYGP